MSQGPTDTLTSLVTGPTEFRVDRRKTASWETDEVYTESTRVHVEPGGDVSRAQHFEPPQVDYDLDDRVSHLFVTYVSMEVDLTFPTDSHRGDPFTDHLNPLTPTGVLESWRLCSYTRVGVSRSLWTEVSYSRRHTYVGCLDTPTRGSPGISGLGVGSHRFSTLYVGFL